ncbi:Protein enabled -like protein [Trichinella nativa]|uniref:Protein enabled-like protein n=1 Tax=Trichinella nativa TaxID=6335 RepID=A0A0V1LIA6_9BILA|nr:Protein enabled -like protein [Trichinella nativa]
MTISEKSMVAIQASVLNYDDAIKKWLPAGGSKIQEMSKVQILHHVENNTFRVVGRKLQDHDVVINCAIIPGLKYNFTSDTFHQWRDHINQKLYGLNFLNLEDAVTFGTVMSRVLEMINSYRTQAQSNVNRPSMAYTEQGSVTVSRQTVNGNTTSVLQDNMEMRMDNFDLRRPIQQENSANNSAYCSMSGGGRTVSQGTLASSPSKPTAPMPPTIQPASSQAAYGQCKRPIPPASTRAQVMSDPPPAPPPPTRSMTTSTPSRQSMAQALASAKLRPVPDEVKNARSSSTGSITETANLNRFGTISSQAHHSIISEITSAIARRNLLKEGGGNQSPSSAVSEVNADQENTPRSDPEIRKNFENRSSAGGRLSCAPVNTDSPQVHRKAPSGSSLSSQDDGMALRTAPSGAVVVNGQSNDPLEQIKMEIILCMKEEACVNTLVKNDNAEMTTSSLVEQSTTSSNCLGCLISFHLIFCQIFLASNLFIFNSCARPMMPSRNTLVVLYGSLPLKRKKKSLFNNLDHQLLYLINFWQLTLVCCGGTWDYYVFTQVWPPGICFVGEGETTPCLKSFKQWTIHGLWPSFSKSQHASPAFCYNKTGFHVNDLEQIIPSLNTFWPNLLKNKSESSLWRHEWLKHGTCAFGTLDSTSVFKYFQLGIQLKLLYSVDLILKMNGIVPTLKNSYKASDFALAIKKATQVWPTVSCTFKKCYKRWLLADIRLCFTKTLLSEDCFASKSFLKFQPDHNNSTEDSTTLPQICKCPDYVPIWYIPAE